MEDALLLPRQMPAQRGISWGAGASIALHLALALAAIWLSPLRQLAASPPDPVSVEIISSSEFARLLEPAPEPTARQEPVAPPEPVPSPTPVPSQSQSQVTHKATELYSAGLLQEPRMARIRQTLTQFADSERIVQLCNIEGLEQIRRAAPDFAPDTLVAYAMSSPIWNGLTLTATGGAFRSRRKWYEVSLKCTAAADYQGVTAFEFTTGKAIPEEKWEAYNLNAEDADE